MALTKLGPNDANTNGNLPAVGSVAPDFILTSADMKDVKLSDHKGKNIVLNIFPSVDTNVCAASVHEFNKLAASVANTVILCVSKDLPFAQKRFCGAEGIDKVYLVSDFRSRGFGKNYGVELIDTAFAGLFARAVVVIDTTGKIKYTELVPQIGEEPDYDSALKAI
ncbi:MAG TPA: thiol peroxidase [Cyclobacteriaceae bacterium]|nr:thiol peroxidase [Cyclobacteriaceae bacterium]